MVQIGPKSRDGYHPVRLRDGVQQDDCTKCGSTIVPKLERNALGRWHTISIVTRDLVANECTGAVAKCVDCGDEFRLGLPQLRVHRKKPSGSRGW